VIKEPIFINEAIEILINHFLLRHTTSTTYYLQGNGQLESTNKVIGSLFTKLVSENCTNWDEHYTQFYKLIAQHSR
jgi:hypothetical protein